MKLRNNRRHLENSNTIFNDNQIVVGRLLRLLDTKLKDNLWIINFNNL